MGLRGKFFGQRIPGSKGCGPGNPRLWEFLGDEQAFDGQNETSAGWVTRRTDRSPVSFFQAARMASILSRFIWVSG